MNKIISIILALGLGLSIQTTLADEADPEKVIKYRQNFMSAIKEHNSNIKSIVKGDVPFKGQLLLHINTLEAMLAEVGNLFPEGSDFGDTSARDAVWEKPEEFQQAVKKAQKAIADLKAVAAGGDLEKTAESHKHFAKAACGGCHKPFRKKDD
jgi:cytochrome c556